MKDSSDDAGKKSTKTKKKTRAGEEMADVLLYLILLADVLGIDLAAATHAKMDDSERRFPP